MSAMDRGGRFQGQTYLLGLRTSPAFHHPVNMPIFHLYTSTGMDTLTTMRHGLAQRQPDYSLPQDFYKDAAIFRLDMEHIFYQHWLFVAHDCELPQIGDYLTQTVGDYSIIIVRDREGSIRAFHNTCRHRGSRICQEHKGNSPTLVCPYHQWTYDLSGKLVFAKDMGRTFETAENGLLAVHCESLAGNIYICLAETAPDFATFRQVVEPYLLPHQLREAKIAYSSTIIEEGNWKLVIENNRECYHCLGSHPELCRTYSDDPDFTGVAGQTSAILSKHWEKCQQLGLPSVFHLSAEGHYRVARMPLISAGESFTMDGKIASQKSMVSVAEKRLGTLLLFHYPNTWNHFLSDHAVTFSVIPLDATRTQVTTKWLVHKDAVEGVDYDLKTLTEVWLATNDQDRRLVEQNQLGINSPAYRPGPYSKTHEDGVIQFIDWYCQASIQALQSSPKFASTTQAQDACTVLGSPVSLPLSKAPLPVEAKASLISTETSGQPISWTDSSPAPQQSEFLYLDQRRPWDAQNELLEVMNIILETPDVKTFCFRTASNNWFNYAPGQFITLELPIAGQMVYRTYTLSSSPSRPIYLTITIKTQAGSYASRWMFDNLHVGMRVRAFGPSGDFHLYKHPAKKYCFISAGSGITPMMSMTSYLFDQGGALDASFIHCARRPSDIIFRSGLELMANRMPGLKLNWIVEERDLHSVWAGYVGRINKAILELSTPDYLEREIFCCGPTPFMQAVRSLLKANGFAMQHYHEENFQAAVVQPEEPLIVDFDSESMQASQAVQVRFTNSGQTIAANQRMTILQASIQAGLNIPSACQFGICGTCKVKCVSGATQMSHSGGISECDIEEGYILACCSWPLSDVDILY